MKKENDAKIITCYSKNIFYSFNKNISLFSVSGSAGGLKNGFDIQGKFAREVCEGSSHGFILHYILWSEPYMQTGTVRERDSETYMHIEL